jgi:hypothetical protein
MAEQFYRYCEYCGSRFEYGVDLCPGCGLRWTHSRSVDTAAHAKAALEQLEALRQSGYLTAEGFEQARGVEEGRLASLARRQAPRAETGSPAFVPPPPDLVQPGMVLKPGALASAIDNLPPSPLSRDFTPPPPGGHAFDPGSAFASRQADILLYLGAFLLGVAALIFVSYQDASVVDGIQLAVLMAYTVAGIAGGMLVRRWDRVREAGHVFLALGALLLPLNFVLLYTSFLRDADISPESIWLLGSISCAIFYFGLAERGLGTLYRIPAAIAAFSAWTSLIAIFDMPLEWVGAWYMLLAVGLAAAPIKSRIPLIAAMPLAAGALVWSYAAAAFDFHWQVPVTHFLGVLGVVALAWRLRMPSALYLLFMLVPATAASVLWALELPDETLAYPFLAAGALALAVRGPLGRFTGLSEHASWFFAAFTTLAPPPLAQETAWTVIGLFASAALMAYIAWRNTDHGLSATLDSTPPPRPGTLAPSAPPETHTHWMERAACAWASLAFAVGASAVLTDMSGVSEPRNGWLYAGVATLAPLVMAAVPRLRALRGIAVALPVSLVLAVLAIPGGDHDLLAATFLAMPGVAWLVAFPISRRWTTSVIGGTFLTFAAFPLAGHFDLAMWQLAGAFALAGGVRALSLTPIRRYTGTPGERDIAVYILSAGLPLLALCVASGSVAEFMGGRTETGRDLMALVVARGDYRVLVAIVAMFAVLLAFEGARISSFRTMLAATGISVLALNLTIGFANPSNVQAYTAPIGVYLLGLGLGFGRNRPPGDFIAWHEALLVAGAAFIVLPQVEQSFEPGGAAWGLAIMVEAFAFLAAGFLVRARWLVPVGVLMLTGAAIRWLVEYGGAIPFWLILGLAGTALLAGGIFILVNAEWWASVRHGAMRWWTGQGRPKPPSFSPPPAQ